MGAISGSLGAHHAHLEGLFDVVVEAARASDWAQYRGRLAGLRRELLQHTAFEEQELFPELARTAKSETELAVLRGQHERLRRHFDILGAAAPEYDPEGCLGELQELGALIREHHARESRLCYPQEATRC